MKLKTILTGSALILSVTSVQAFATPMTYYFDDNFFTFDSYLGDENDDVLGTPDIDWMKVTIDSDTHQLLTVEVLVPGRLTYDSLFIDTDGTSSEDWDYFVRDNTSNSAYSPDASDLVGLYSVADDYTYTTVQSRGGRDGHANGFVDFDDTLNNPADSLTTMDSAFINHIDYSFDLLTYDFSLYNIIIEDAFTIAYMPWCANDVIQGSAPIPEPATMLLFGTGLISIASFSRKKSKKA